MKAAQQFSCFSTFVGGIQRNLLRSVLVASLISAASDPAALAAEIGFSGISLSTSQTGIFFERDHVDAFGEVAGVRFGRVVALADAQTTSIKVRSDRGVPVPVRVHVTERKSKGGHFVERGIVYFKIAGKGRHRLDVCSLGVARRDCSSLNILRHE